MKPRILLINPWIHDFAAFNLWSRPLGLLKVARFLSAFEADLSLIDCTDSCEPQRYGAGKYRSEIIGKPDLLRRVPRYYKRYGMSVPDFRVRLAALQPVDVVLMTTIMTYWYPGAQEAIRLVRESAGTVPVILGGIYPTLHPDHARSESGADRIHAGPVGGALIRTFRELGLEPVSKRGPVPHGLPGLGTRSGFAPLETSRGCPYRCSYCASKLLSPGYERRPVIDVLEEVRRHAAGGVRDFVFYDDALLYNADEHIKPLLEAVIRSGLDIRLHAPNGLHARFIDAELSSLMKRAGFTTIRLSLETIDSVRQEETGGKVATADFERAVANLKGAGFAGKEIGSYLLYGLPGQELEEVERGVEFLKSLGVKIYLAEFSPIRGTASWDELVKRGVISDSLDPLLCNNTVFPYLYAGYDWQRVERLKLAVKEHNRREKEFHG